MPNPFGPLYSFQTIVLVLCAVGYYKAAVVEDSSGIVWACLSAFVYYITWLVLGWGYLGNFAGQLGLLGAITVYRVVRDMRRPS